MWRLPVFKLNGHEFDSLINKNALNSTIIIFGIAEILLENSFYKNKMGL